MGRSKLDMSNLTDSNIDLSWTELNGLGSVHEKIDFWTGPYISKLPHTHPMTSWFKFLFFFIPGWAKKVLSIMHVIMITHKYYQDEVFYYFLLQLLASKLCSNTQGKSVAWRLGRVYSRARHCRISAIWEKMPHKIYLVASNGAHKK